MWSFVSGVFHFTQFFRGSSMSETMVSHCLIDIVSIPLCFFSLCKSLLRPCPWSLWCCIGTMDPWITSFLLPFLFFWQHSHFELESFEVLYYLSNAHRSFCFSYFSNMVLHLCRRRPGLPSSFLHFPHSRDDRCMTPHPPLYGLRCGLSHFFAQADLEPQSFQSLPLE
jgi:hypothetical protein